MKVIAFNGSPRKKWNTATLLEKALEGAASKGAETQLIHLYDLDYKVCKSCFACKTIGGQSYGKCAIPDELTPIFEEIEKVDSIILGSPIYFGTVSGEMRSFMERLMFPYFTYTNPPQSLFPKKINVGFIYTMGVTPELMKEFGYDHHFGRYEKTLKMIFGALESLYSCDTFQFKDYSKVVADRFDPKKKAERRRKIFPKDCERAFSMGVRLVTKKG